MSNSLGTGHCLRAGRVRHPHSRGNSTARGQISNTKAGDEANTSRQRAGALRSKRLAGPELGGPWSAAAANRQVCFSRHVRHLTALRGGSSSRQRLGEARSGVGRLGTVAGTLSTRSLSQREGAARSSNLATASARPLVTLTTDPCRLATYGRGNRVAAPPPHKQTPGGHRSVELPDAASAVPHRRIAAAAGARAGDLAGGPCGRSPPLGRVQARHGGPEPARARGRSGSEPLDLTVVTASSVTPRAAVRSGGAGHGRVCAHSALQAGVVSAS